MNHENPSLLGQLICHGWIGEHPGDGGDFSMLMIYSPGDGELGVGAAESASRDIVTAWGMRLGGFAENPVIAGQPVTASLDGITVHVAGLPGLDISRPTSAEWAAIARRRQQIFVSLTTRPWPEGPSASVAETFRFIEDARTIESAVSMLVPVA